MQVREVGFSGPKRRGQILCCHILLSHGVTSQYVGLMGDTRFTPFPFGAEARGSKAACAALDGPKSRLPLAPTPRQGRGLCATSALVENDDAHFFRTPSRLITQKNLQLAWLAPVPTFPQKGKESCQHGKAGPWAIRVLAFLKPKVPFAQLGRAQAAIFLIACNLMLPASRRLPGFFAPRRSRRA